MIVLELILGLLPLDIPPPASPTSGGGPDAPVYPLRSNGFAAYLVGGFFALGLILLVGVLLGLKPKRANPGGSGGIPSGSDTAPERDPPSPPEINDR